MSGPNKRVRLAVGTLEALDAFVLAMAAPYDDASGEVDRLGFRAGRPTTDAPWLSINGEHLELFTGALDRLAAERLFVRPNRLTRRWGKWRAGCQRIGKRTHREGKNCRDVNRPGFPPTDTDCGPMNVLETWYRCMAQEAFVPRATARVGGDCDLGADFRKLGVRSPRRSLHAVLAKKPRW